MQALTSAGISIVLNLRRRLLLKLKLSCIIPRKRENLTLIARQMPPAGVGNEEVAVATAEAGAMDVGVALAPRMLVQSRKQ